MAWRGVLQHGPLDGSEGRVEHPVTPPDELWPMRCPGGDRCALRALADEQGATIPEPCEAGGTHWLIGRHPALAGLQFCYERVDVDRQNRHVYRYPDGLLPGQAIMAEPTMLVTGADRESVR